MSWWTADLAAVAVAVVKAVVLMLGMVLVAAMLIWVERRLLALWQDRYGPNRVGPFGLLQVVADMIKIFFKEDWVPPFVDKPVFLIAPAVAMITAMLAFLLVPVTASWGVAPDLNVGVLLFFALAGLEVYAAMLGGWASNSKYSLIGGPARGGADAELRGLHGHRPDGRGDTDRIVPARSHRRGTAASVVHRAAVLRLLYVLAGRGRDHASFPFDMPEAENELTAGYHTEYSGMKFGMFYVGEYVGIVVISSLLTTLFFGGWQGPFTDRLPALGFLWFALKTFFFIMLFILMRGALARPRYDQIMALGWKFCLPLSLVNMLATAAIVLAGSPGV